MSNIFQQMQYRRSLNNGPAHAQGQSRHNNQPGSPRYGLIPGSGFYAQQFRKGYDEGMSMSHNAQIQRHVQQQLSRSMARGYFTSHYPHTGSRNQVRQPVNIRVSHPTHGSGRAGGVLGTMRGRGRVGGMLAQQTMQDVLDGNGMMIPTEADKFSNVSPVGNNPAAGGNDSHEKHVTPLPK